MLLDASSFKGLEYWIADSVGIYGIEKKLNAK